MPTPAARIHPDPQLEHPTPGQNRREAFQGPVAQLGGASQGRLDDVGGPCGGSDPSAGGLAEGRAPSGALLGGGKSTPGRTKQDRP